MTKRDRLMLLAVLSVALLGGFWMLVLSPQRKAAADAAARVTAAQTALDAARQQVSAGRAAQQAFRRDRTTIVKLGRVVPETDDIPTLLTQLQALATKEKVKFKAYAIDSAGASAATTATGSETDTTAAQNVGTQTGNGSTQAIAPLFPPGSIEIAGGLGRTPISLEFEGTYFQLERYLRAVQRFAVLSQKSSKTNGRLMIVDGFAYKAADEVTEESNDAKAKIMKNYEKQPKLLATLSASVYFAPPLETPSASSAAAGSTATPAGATAAPSGSSTGTAAIGGVQ